MYVTRTRPGATGIDAIEMSRRRAMVSRALGASKGSLKVIAVEQINDRFIHGQLEQVDYLMELKKAIKAHQAAKNTVPKGPAINKSGVTK